MRRAVVLCLLAAGCHVRHQTHTLRPLSSSREVQTGAPVPRAPTLVVSDAATLQFVEPLECPTVEMVTTQASVETDVDPNLATFVVGVVVTAAAGIVTARGAAGDSNALVGGGVAGLAVGLPLLVGPWIGNGVEREEGAINPPAPRAGPPQPCGSRPFAAKSAVIQISGVEVFGTVDATGTFSVSPYALVDAYRTAMLPAWDVTAVVHTGGEPSVVSTVIDGSVLARHAPTFLRTATQFDATVGPMRVIPNMTAGAVRVSMADTAAGPVLRLVLPLANAGPGEAWGVRGVIVSSSKAVDGRVLYFGHIPRGTSVNGELVIPLSTHAAEALRSGTIDLSIELRDAHGTAPATPVKYQGAVFGDLPR